MPIAGFDIEDGNEGRAPPPPQSLSVTKRCAATLICVGTVFAVAYSGLRYRSNTDLGFKLRPMQMGGDFNFQILDSGSTDKMLLRLQVEEGKQYTIKEHSVRRITRSIMLPQAELRPSDPVEQDVSMTFHYSLDARLEAQKAVRLRFNCTEFSILHKDPNNGIWVHPPMWATMGSAVLHRPFTATVAYNGTILNIDASAVHEAVVRQMHQAGALPVELTTALEITQPSAIKGVFDSLGAQWNTPGEDSVSGPVVLANPPEACPVQGVPDHDLLLNPEEVQGRIVLVKRGKCTFLQKVKLMHRLMAVGVIVMNTEQEDLLLMGGSSSERIIPSVMIKMEVGQKMIAAIQAGETVQVNLLTGVDAMTKKSSVGALGGATEDEAKTQKAKLPDFLGYNSMIEDQIKRRFTIFPGGPVGVGDIWHRKVRIQLEGQQVPTWVDESYTLLQMPDAPPCERSRWSSSGSCDSSSTREGPVRILMNTTAIQKAGASARPQAMVGPMNADDIQVKESGEIIVDAGSGLLTSGTAKQTMIGKARFSQVFINGQMQQGAFLKTTMTADTRWQGEQRQIFQYDDLPQKAQVGMR